MLQKILINLAAKFRILSPIFWSIGLALIPAWLFFTVGLEVTEGVAGEASWFNYDQKIFAMVISARREFVTDLMIALTYLGSTFSTARIYLGVHYPTDVLGGYLIGFTVLFLAIAYDKFMLLKKNYFLNRSKS